MTDNEKKLIQARHRLEEAQARDRVKQRKARTRRLIQEGAVLEKALPQTVSMSLNELETYLHELTIEYAKQERPGSPGRSAFPGPKGALSEEKNNPRRKAESQ